jgi:hypothetical protein
MIHPNLTGRRRARATNHAHGPRTVTLTPHPLSGYGIRWVVKERLGARPILTSRLVARLDSLKTPWCRWSPERSKKTPWCRWSSISRRGVGGEIPVPSLFRPRTFRSEAAAYIDNRREAIIRRCPLALNGQPMNTALGSSADSSGPQWHTGQVSRKQR